MCVCVCVSAYDSVIKYHSILLALQVLIYLICCNNIEERIDNHPPHSKYHVGTSRTSLRTFKLIKSQLNQVINQSIKLIKSTFGPRTISYKPTCRVFRLRMLTQTSFSSFHLTLGSMRASHSLRWDKTTHGVAVARQVLHTHAKTCINVVPLNRVMCTGTDHDNLQAPFTGAVE